jgi:hypothetical protein
MTTSLRPDRHRAARRVLQAHVEAGDRLLGVGLERAGLAGEQRDLDVLAGLGEGGRGERGESQRDGQKSALHEEGLLSWVRPSMAADGSDQCKPRADAHRIGAYPWFRSFRNQIWRGGTCRMTQTV